MVKQSSWWLLILTVLLFSIQVLGVVIYIYSFIPYPSYWYEPFSKGVEPERETLFYIIFISLNVGLMPVAIKWILPGLNSSINLRQLKCWLSLDGLWCFLMVFCFFKWTSYRYSFWNIIPYENSAWVQPFFIGVCALSILSKVFFVEIESLSRSWKNFISSERWLFGYPILYQVFFILGLILLLYIPRPQEVVALALSWDQWNHLDSVTGWFINHGWLVNEEQTIDLLIFATIIYLVAYFYFVRTWLKSWLLAGAATLLLMKMGLFYASTAPCVWINPSNSLLIHGWEIILFYILWLVSNKHRQWFYPCVFVAGLLIITGWVKSNGLIDAIGYNNQPMMAPLRVRQFFPFFMGYFIPVFYILSLLAIMGKKNQQPSLNFQLPVVFCIYGLMVFIDYIEHPMIGFYGALMAPAILIIFWWLKQGFSIFPLAIQRSLHLAVLIVCLGALLTNRWMMTYPNLIFQDKNRFAQERSYLEHFDAIEQSSILIEKLSQENQKIVLLSNFETALLAKAHRQSLFINSPVMFSKLGHEPGGLNLRTKKECLDLIDSMTEENASYVFIDQRLLQLSPDVLGNSGLNAVLNFIKNHYQVYARQGFLVALQRR